MPKPPKPILQIPKNPPIDFRANGWATKRMRDYLNDTRLRLQSWQMYNKREQGFSDQEIKNIFEIPFDKDFEDIVNEIKSKNPEAFSAKVTIGGRTMNTMMTGEELDEQFPNQFQIKLPGYKDWDKVDISKFSGFRAKRDEFANQFYQKTDKIRRDWNNYRDDVLNRVRRFNEEMYFYRENEHLTDEEYDRRMAARRQKSLDDIAQREKEKHDYEVEQYFKWENRNKALQAAKQEQESQKRAMSVIQAQRERELSTIKGEDTRTIAPTFLISKTGEEEIQALKSGLEKKDTDLDMTSQLKSFFEDEIRTVKAAMASQQKQIIAANKVIKNVNDRLTRAQSSGSLKEATKPTTNKKAEDDTKSTVLSKWGYNDDISASRVFERRNPVIPRGVRPTIKSEQPVKITQPIQSNLTKQIKANAQLINALRARMNKQEKVGEQLVTAMQQRKEEKEQLETTVTGNKTIDQPPQIRQERAMEQRRQRDNERHSRMMIVQDLRWQPPSNIEDYVTNWIKNNKRFLRRKKRSTNND